MKRFVVLLLFVCSVGLSAASHGPHDDVVRQAKADLQAAGADLSGDCGAFQIVKLVAWRLKAEGAGLLDKPAGAGCQGFSKDVISYQDGQIYDILVASGDPGGNGPVWNDDGQVDPARWRAPIDPGPIAGPPPRVPPPSAPPPVVDLGPLNEKVSRLTQQLGALSVIVDTLTAWSDRVETRFAADEAALAALAAKPIPMACSASVFGVPVHCALK